MQLTISVLAARPDLAEAMWGMDTPWPEFMRHDPIGGLFYSNVEARFAEFVLVGQDDAGQVVALAFSIPFPLDATSCPLNGWDGVIRNGVLAAFARRTTRRHLRDRDRDPPRSPKPGCRHRCSSRCATTPHATASPSSSRRSGPATSRTSTTPMDDYAFQVRDDGLPVDPWLRVHVRAGGVIDKVAPRSMVIPGTLEEWREWTGLPFDETGPVEVPRALAPVWCDVEHGTATYVEPNVWLRHRQRLSQAAWPIVPGIAGGTQAQVSLHAR